MFTVQRELDDAGQPHLGRGGEVGNVDLHCHCLCGLDDGPATPAEALDLCRALVHDGIGTVVATPHQLGRYDGRNHGQLVREAVEALRATLAEHQISLNVLPGAEVRVDERIPALVRSGEVLTLADRAYLLLEIPPESYIDPLPLIRWLAKQGIETIIAHPERHRPIRRRLEIVSPWVDNGATLQVNASSLLGELGPEAEQTAWALVGGPWPVLVATDAHNIKTRPPRLSRAIEQIQRRLGAETSRRVCIDTPRNVLGPLAARPLLHPERV